MLPEVLEFQEQYVEMIFGSRKPTLFLFRQTRDVNSKKLREVFRESSKMLK